MTLHVLHAADVSLHVQKIDDALDVRAHVRHQQTCVC